MSNAAEWTLGMSRTGLRDLGDEEEARRWIHAMSDDEFKRMLLNQYHELDRRLEYIEERLEIMQRVRTDD